MTRPVHRTVYDAAMNSGALLSASDLFGRRAVEGWTVSGVTVRLARRAEVDAIIKRLHYSGSTVWSSSLHMVVFSAGVLVGGLQFGPAMNPASGAKVVRGSTVDTWLELNRMAFISGRPENCGTRAISAAVRLIRHVRPSVEWIQSFADERCRKHGAVYQAASFLYCGEHRATFYELDGEWFHKSAWNRASVDRRGWGCGPKLQRFNREKHRATAVTFRQFRYVKCITRRARKNLLLDVLPYPKPVGIA